MEIISRTWIPQVTSVLEWLGIAIILIAVAGGAIYGITDLIRRRSLRESIRHYRFIIGRSLQLGLEVLVAADIIRTVTVELTLRSVATLGLLVLIRTFLSWSISVEVDGRWPWRGAGGLSPEEKTLERKE